MRVAYDVNRYWNLGKSDVFLLLFFVFVFNYFIFFV